MTDDALIARFLTARDEQAFRELYRRHSPAVYGTLRRLADPATDDADEALQDAWLRAAAGLSTFRGESVFRTWLIGIAINCLRERARARVRTRAASELVEVASAGTDRTLDVAQVLAALSPAHRQILVLHDVEGYTHDQIADALGIEQGTSKSRLSRARQLFRERWRQAPAQPVGETP
jgi:RNA polymerase sigma-70 factor (ECF subfamily)